MEKLISSFTFTGFNIISISSVLLILWFLFAALLFVASFVMAVIAIWNKLVWSMVGRYFFLSLKLLICNNINMLAFMRFFRVTEGLPTHSYIARIAAFFLFLFANITVYYIVLHAHKKARMGLIFKMIITIILLYIPISIVFSFGR